MRPSTFLFLNNRDGVPYQAYEYICRHGYESQTCGVGTDNLCPEVGRIMVEWENSMFKQFRERLVVRNSLLGG